MKKKFTTKEFVGVTLFAAISMIMGAIPQLGYITLGFLPFSITILFIPVLLGTIIYGKKAGLILGFTFGLSSLMVAWMRPTTPFDLFFRNPLVSVLPRVLFPLLFVWIYSVQEKFSPKTVSILFSIIFYISSVIVFFAKWGNSIAVVLFVLGIVSTIITIITHIKKEYSFKYFIPVLFSVLLHSLLVLGAIGLIYGNELGKNINIGKWIIGIVMTNGLLEAATSAILLQLIAPVVKGAVRNE